MKTCHYAIDPKQIIKEKTKPKQKRKKTRKSYVRLFYARIYAKWLESCVQFRLFVYPLFLKFS